MTRDEAWKAWERAWRIYRRAVKRRKWAEAQAAQRKIMRAAARCDAIERTTPEPVGS